MAMVSRSPFAPAEIDFSGIGRIADSYFNAQDSALKRQDLIDRRAEREVARGRETQLRNAFSGGLPTGPDGSIDFGALAKRASELGMVEQAVDWGGKAADLADRDRKFASEQQFKRAQIEKMRREAAESGTTYGKSGSIFQAPDGKFYSIQFGGDGSRSVLPLEVPGSFSPSSGMQPAAPKMPQQGAGRFAAPGLTGQSNVQPPTPLTPARGVSVVGNQMYDSATGTPVRDVGGNIAEGERQKVVGREIGEGQAGLPKLSNAFREYEVKNRTVLSNIDTALGQANSWTTGFIGAMGRHVPGTAPHDLSKTLLSIQANLGFETLQQMRDNSPTGGALGQVTERELELLQSTWTSLAQSQSPEQFRQNLLELKRIKTEYAAIKRRAYEADVARFGAANVPNPSASSPGAGAAFDPLGIR